LKGAIDFGMTLRICFLATTYNQVYHDMGQQRGKPGFCTSHERFEMLTLSDKDM
jgi:hypothetical protein